MVMEKVYQCSSSRRPELACRLASFMINIKFQFKINVRQTTLIQAWTEKRKKTTDGLNALLITVICIVVFV